MRSPPGLILTLGALTLGWVCAPAGGAEKVEFSQHIAPLLTQYCTGCHGGAKPKGGLALDRYKDEASLARDPQVWEKVARMLRAREMPPEGRRQPTPQERERLLGWIDVTVSRVDCTRSQDPGRVTIRRLNRVEYNNTVRDLVGVTFRPADDFPADDAGYGFDNIGDVLSISPVLLEKYLAAAEKIVQTAFATPALRARILIRQPTEQTKKECARQILENFARRAFRRPVRPEELDRLVRFVELAEKNGDGFETGIQLALQAVLISPHFLFRVELDRQPRGDAVHPIGDYELATRLSYFLWSSMPDDELFRLAGQGTLRRPEVLDGQVRRMLHDPKARALVENFAGQWLQLRNLKSATPDPGLFPSFDELLRTAMLRETELFFETIVKEDRSVLDFLDADFTFLNERLARHYGIDGVKGDEFRRVSLAGGPRGGVLTQASILTITSNPTRTSPVKRGKWILENILGTPPPPPPPDAGELSEDKNAVLSGSLRQRMERHRSKPICASCHQRMDPLGFGFENFDAVGAWRTQDGKFPIDASGTLPDGQSFQGPRELRDLLKKRKDDFARCLSEKMLTYALGRGVESYDRCAVDRTAKELAKSEYRFSGLVLAIVHSDPFQLRRGKGG
jgi:hypothetical protein